MSDYLCTEFVKLARYPYTYVLLLFLVAITIVLVEGFFHDALNVYQFWHQQNPTKYFEDFTFISIQKHINLLLFIGSSLFCILSFYLDGKAGFFAKRLTLPLQHAHFLGAKLIIVLLPAAIYLTLTYILYHIYLLEYEQYFTHKVYSFRLMLQDACIRMLLLVPLVPLVMSLILLSRLRVLPSLILALIAFYSLSIGMLPLGGIHKLIPVIAPITFIDTIAPCLIWSLLLFSFTTHILQSNRY